MQEVIKVVLVQLTNNIVFFIVYFCFNFDLCQSVKRLNLAATPTPPHISNSD